MPTSYYGQGGIWRGKPGIPSSPPSHRHLFAGNVNDRETFSRSLPKLGATPPLHYSFQQMPPWLLVSSLLARTILSVHWHWWLLGCSCLCCDHVMVIEHIPLQRTTATVQQVTHLNAVGSFLSSVATRYPFDAQYSVYSNRFKCAIPIWKSETSMEFQRYPQVALVSSKYWQTAKQNNKTHITECRVTVIRCHQLLLLWDITLLPLLSHGCTITVVAQNYKDYTAW